MFSNRLYSPLRYPGGKAPFAPFIATVMEKNRIAGGHYLEPYAGGAGVALDLLFHGHASHIPYAVWYRTVRFDTANRDREARGDFYPRLRWLDVLAAKAKLRLCAMPGHGGVIRWPCGARIPMSARIGS